MRRSEIVAEARKYLGSPFRRHGRTLAGIDCGGLPLVVGRALGEILVDVGVSARTVPPGETLRMLEVNLVERLPLSVEPGSVAIFSLGATDARHIGLVGERQDGRLTLVHASARARKVVEEPLSIWLPRLVAAFDFRTVTP